MLIDLIVVVGTVGHSKVLWGNATNAMPESGKQVTQ